MPDDAWRAAYFGRDPRTYRSPYEAEAERRRIEVRMTDFDEQDRIERELAAKARELQRVAEKLKLHIPLTEDELRYAAILAERLRKEEEAT